MNKYKVFDRVIDITDTQERQRAVYEDLQNEMDDFQIENSITVMQLIQSESLYKNKCHLTLTLEYIMNEDRNKMEVLN